MTRILLHILLLPLAFSCQKATLEKPIPTQAIDLLTVPIDTLHFTANLADWKASLQSFAQPIPLNLKITNTGFKIYTDKKNGIIEGPAELTIEANGQFFYYHINLLNSEDKELAFRDYRSPKTVNPDSSLEQHKMIHQIDQWRNLQELPNEQGLFYETIRVLNPKVGTFLAQEGEPLSSFYVQAGSTTAVPLSYTFLTKEGVIEVKAGPLKDEYNNLVSDGTLVRFVYGTDAKRYQTETVLLDGFASSKILRNSDKPIWVWAEVNQRKSRILKIRP